MAGAPCGAAVAAAAARPTAGVSLKRKRAMQHRKERHTASPHISLCAVVAAARPQPGRALGQLRRHVGGRADGQPHEGGAPSGPGVGVAKVTKAQARRLWPIEQKVVELDIPVADARLVEELDRRDVLLEEVPRLVLAHEQPAALRARLPQLCDAVGERAATACLHDKAQVAVGQHQRFGRHEVDVRVAGQRVELYFALQPRQLDLRDRALHEFDGDLAARGSVDAQPRLAGCALPKHADNLVEAVDAEAWRRFALRLAAALAAA
mmetsp:Transcript_30395/g.90109  ORF Transcript_30395/g.90109 Transcript_30395/m.90109 type:complete len:265 (-) Transcript_30395:600-1394(-)